MLYYFNPGHESAILNGSKFYHAPAKVLKMQHDLAFLPAWYAQPDSFVLTENPLDAGFLSITKQLNPDIQAIQISNIEKQKKAIENEEVDLWGMSPQAIHFLQMLSEKQALNLKIPSWNDAYKELSSRSFAEKSLRYLIKKIPEINADILPTFYSDLKEIEFVNRHSIDRLLIKSPFSSSGRGLLWLEEKELSRSSRQILQGMLNKQEKISVEKVLDKKLDFSMHFQNNKFIGYSLFTTNSKGAYEKTILASQEKIINKITSFVALELLEKVKTHLNSFLKENIISEYTGNIGIDMMVYQSAGKFHLHPCVEINLRKSMGYLAIIIFEKYIHPDSEGYFSVQYKTDIEKESLLRIENNRIKEGSLYLCPVNNQTDYKAMICLSSEAAQRTSAQ